VVNAADTAGNELNDHNAGTLTIDRDMPGVVLTQATPTTINLSVNALTIQFEVNETPAADPILRIGADTIATIPVIEDITPGKRYTYTIPITHSESEGVKKATAEVYDAAGNHYYAELTYALGGSPDLIYDFTLPRVITRNANPERANVTTQGIQVLTSFSEPVQKPAIATVQVQKRVGANWVTQSGMASRATVEDRPVGYTHALYFSLLDMLISNDGEYRIHMQVTDENGNTAVTQGGDLLNLGEFRIDMTLPLIDATASVAAICTEPTDLNPGETDYCSRPGHIDKTKAKAGDTIYYKLVFDRSDPYYEFDDIVDVWPTVEVSGLGAMAQLSQITFAGDTAPYTFIYRRKITLTDTEDISSYALISMEDTAGNTYRKLSDDLVRTDVTKPTLVAYSTTPSHAKVGTEIVVNFTLSEPVASVSFNGAGLAFAGGCTTTDNISYRCTHTVTTGDTEGTKNFSATATDQTGNTSATLTLGSTVIDKTDPAVTITSFLISTVTTVNAMPAVSHHQPDIGVSFQITPVSQFVGYPVVRFGGAEMSGLSCTGTTTYTCSGTYTVPSGETTEGVKSVTVTVTDAAGNVTTQTPSSVLYDFTGPRLVSALFERTPNFAPSRDGATMIQHYSIRDPYTNEFVTASLTLYADEPLAEGPTLNGFNLGTATVNYDEVYYTRALSDSDAEGLYEIQVVWSDWLGNSVTRPIVWRLAIDKSEPASIDGEKVTFTRKPWGTDESGGLPSFSLAAGIGTVIDTGIEMIQAIAPNGLLVGTATRQGDGSFSIDELTTSDVPVIYLNPVKKTGMRIAYAPADPGATLEPARHVNWHATLNGKVPYSMLENPLVMVKTRRFMPHLDQGDEEPTASELQGVMSNDGTSFSHTSGYSWQRMDEGNHPLWRMGQQLLSEMVLDPNTGTVYSIGGWYWTGAAPGYGNPTEYIDNLYTYDLTTDRANDPDPNGNKPPAQAHHGTLYDDINDVLVVFGGKLYGPTNDLYFYYPEVNRWYLIEPTGTLPSARNHMGIAHDRKRDRYIIWGGSPDNGTSGLLADMWEYDRVANEWSEVTQNGTIPSVRRGAKMVYDSRRHRLLLFGGQTTSNTLLNDLYEFDIDSATWYTLSPTGTDVPLAQMGAQGAYDGRYQKFYIFGGTNDSAPTEGDVKQHVYAYDIPRNEWSRIATTTGKIRMVYDPTNSRLVLIGRHYEDMTYLYQRQTVSLPGGTSTTFTYGTNTPSARYGSTVVYDKNGNRTFMYGGANADGSLNELWQYDHASNQWTQLTNSGWPGLTARVFAAGTFDLNR
ncbi:MAG TPA: kelch repeat-containing protein, partial [bacterium]|nr:kelch repeat-containing protein [bacterium]